MIKCVITKTVLLFFFFADYSLLFSMCHSSSRQYSRRLCLFDCLNQGAVSLRMLCWLPPRNQLSSLISKYVFTGFKTSELLPDRCFLSDCAYIKHKDMWKFLATFTRVKRSVSLLFVSDNLGGFLERMRLPSVLFVVLNQSHMIVTLNINR